MRREDTVLKISNWTERQQFGAIFVIFMESIETMNDNTNRDKAVVKLKGNIWKVKVMIHFMKDDDKTEISQESKHWKIKEFLN